MSLFSNLQDMSSPFQYMIKEDSCKTQTASCELIIGKKKLCQHNN